MKIDLQRKSFATFGLKGTGKSTFINGLAEQFGAKVLVYDTLGEVPPEAVYYSYQPRIRNSISELETVIMSIKDTGQYELFIIDECNRFAPSKPAPLPPELSDLNDQNRHYGLSVGYIARRPVQLNQDLTELSDYIFVFRLKGNRDIKYLNDLSGGLGDTVLKLKEFQFVVVMPDRSYFISNPIKPSDQWLQAAKRHLNLKML